MSTSPEFDQPEEVMAEAGVLPSPMSLHWAWVLVLGVLTGGWFYSYWLYKQAAWMQRLRGRRSVYGWALVQLILTSLILPVAIGGIIAGTPVHNGLFDGSATAFALVVAFELQRDLQDADPELRLSGMMTFFFGTVYLQYWLNRWPRRVAQVRAVD